MHLGSADPLIFEPLGIGNNPNSAISSKVRSGYAERWADRVARIRERQSRLQ